MAGGAWRKTTCEYCGARYEHFRPEQTVSWNDAYEELLRESRDHAARGDYSKRVTRRRILGRMFENKQMWWKLHLEECEMAAEWAAAEGGDAGGERSTAG